MDMVKICGGGETTSLHRLNEHQPPDTSKAVTELNSIVSLVIGWAARANGQHRKRPPSLPSDTSTVERNSGDDGMLGR